MLKKCQGRNIRIKMICKMRSLPGQLIFRRPVTITTYPLCEKIILMNERRYRTFIIRGVDIRNRPRYLSIGPWRMKDGEQNDRSDDTGCSDEDKKTLDPRRHPTGSRLLLAVFFSLGDV